MPHAHGTHIGGVRTLEELRLRCVCRPGSDCWEFRDARGRKHKPGIVQRIWVHGIGSMTVTAAAWRLADRASVGLQIGRACESSDCVNPDHLAPMTRREISERAHRLGKYHTPARKAALRRAQSMKTKVPTWAAEMICDKSKTRRELAEHFGCSVGCISAARARFRAASGAAA